VSQQRFDFDAASAFWGPRVCGAGAAWLRRSMPRWGDARYMGDLVAPDDPDPGRLGRRGTW
jgi:hypothetical protein